MPNLDGTGPLGKGRLTGRRRGHCRGNKRSQIEKSENKFNKNEEGGYRFDSDEVQRGLKKRIQLGRRNRGRRGKLED